MTGMLTRGATEKGEAPVKSVAKRIVRDAPRLQELAPEELEKLARVVVAESLKDDLRRAADLERVDYQAERARFILRASRTGSERTRKLYAAALGRLEAWCERQGLSPLDLTPAREDDWISDLKSEGRASATVRLDVSGASAFWRLERRHPELRNPFRGTRERPPRKAARLLEVPNAKEIEEMMDAADPVMREAIAVMARAGLRVGALPGLSVHGERFTTTTKGKEQSGRITEDVRKEIERAGLSLHAPFSGVTALRIADRFLYLAKRLQETDKLRARYSVHDLRHCFAVQLYQETRDVYAVEKALNHATLAVTESYLRSLGLAGA